MSKDWHQGIHSWIPCIGLCVVALVLVFVWRPLLVLVVRYMGIVLESGVVNNIVGCYPQIGFSMKLWWNFHTHRKLWLWKSDALCLSLLLSIIHICLPSFVPSSFPPPSLSLSLSCRDLSLPPSDLSPSQWSLFSPSDLSLPPVISLFLPVISLFLPSLSLSLSQPFILCLLTFQSRLSVLIPFSLLGTQGKAAASRTHAAKTGFLLFCGRSVPVHQQARNKSGKVKGRGEEAC